jgi:hypothetical protein
MRGNDLLSNTICFLLIHIPRLSYLQLRLKEALNSLVPNNCLKLQDLFAQR